MELTAVRGMHDAFGEDLARWQHVETIVRGVLERYGYREIRTPAVEKLDVFKAVGDDTDIVEVECTPDLDQHLPATSSKLNVR